MKLKHLLSTGLFLVLLTATLSGINWLLRPKYTSYNSKWPETTTFRQFYQMDRNSVDVLFLGSSVCANAFSPQEIYNTTGIRSYNLGSEQQSVILSYYWLKEALRFQSPQAVVFDVKMCYPYLENADTTNMSEPIMRKCLDPMRWSPVKMEAVRDVCRIDPTQQKLSYYLTNIRFHRHWQDLSREDIQVDDPSFAKLKGFAPLIFKEYVEFEPLVVRDTEVQEGMLPVMQDYLDRMADLCAANGIQLILVNLPGNDQTEGTHSMLTAYAEEKGALFYNLGEASLYADIGAVQPDEVIVHHDNLWGADRISRYVGRILQEVCRVPAVEDVQYEESRANYVHLHEDAELPFIKDLETYLEKIGDPRYAVMITMTDGEVNRLSDKTMERMRGLGISCGLQPEMQGNFFAVVADGSVREGWGGPDIVTDCGKLADGAWYELHAGKLGTSSIVISGTEYARPCGGIQFVVYDTVSGKVLDSPAFKTSDGSVVR